MVRNRKIKKVFRLLQMKIFWSGRLGTVRSRLFPTAASHIAWLKIPSLAWKGVISAFFNLSSLKGDSLSSSSASKTAQNSIPFRFIEFFTNCFFFSFKTKKDVKNEVRYHKSCYGKNFVLPTPQSRKPVAASGLLRRTLLVLISSFFPHKRPVSIIISMYKNSQS